MKSMVSIIIPVYNEENSIRKVMDKLCNSMLKVDFPYEIIMVDDGSTDATFDVIRQNRDIKIIHRERRYGYGAALKLGFSQSQGEILVFIDGDDTYPVEDTPRLIKTFMEQPCDMLIAARVYKYNKINSLISRTVKNILRMIAEYLTETKIPDLNSGFRVIKRAALESYLNILPQGFSFTTTLTMASLLDNLSVRFISIDYYDRKYGKSKIRPLRDSLNFLQLIIRICLMFNPLKIFLPIFICLFLITGIKIILDLSYIGRVTGTTLFLGISAFNIFTLGLLADLIVNLSRKNNSSFK